jgi:hypothetical protein
MTLNKRPRTALAIAAFALALSAAAPTATALSSGSATHTAGQADKVEKIRGATDDFHNIATAESAGYVSFKDIHGKSCIAMKGMGGMGVHYVNPALIADPAIDLTAPEVLVYAPDRDGTLRLAAVEYLVDKAAWDAANPKPPELFRGEPFMVTEAPNRYGLDTFYSQHVWAWKANPEGLLAMWNPNVHCAWA